MIERGALAACAQTGLRNLKLDYADLRKVRVGGSQGGIELALETPNYTTREIGFEVSDLSDIETRCTDEGYLIWSIGEESGLYGHEWIRAGMVIQMPSGTSRHQPT